MVISDFNLDKLAQDTRTALDTYEQLLFYSAKATLQSIGFTAKEAADKAPRIAFVGTPEFIVPNKPYSLRAELPVIVNEARAGKLVLKGFLPGDGTGNLDVYKLGQVIVPEELTHETHQERVFPTARQNTVVEGFLPLLTAHVSGSSALYCTSLTYLVPDQFAPGRVSLKRGVLGVGPSEADDILFGPKKARPKVDLTVGLLGGVQRDQHSVYRLRRHELEDETVALGAFLAVRRDNLRGDDLRTALKPYAVPPVTNL